MCHVNSDRRDQQGFVLPTVLIILLSLTMIAVAVAYRNTVDELIAGNQRDAVNAITIAESGQADGFEFLSSNFGGEEAMQTLLETCPTGAGSISGGNFRWRLELLQLEGSEDPLCVDGVPNSAATTPAQYDSGDMLVVWSDGQFNGALREVETIYYGAPFVSRHAILVEDDLLLKGETEILDDYAYVHSNSDITVGGQPTVEQTVSATGEIIVEGQDSNLLGDPDIVYGIGRVEIPYVDPLAFREDATIVLTWDCKVLARDGDGNEAWIATADKNNKYRGWNCDQSLNLWSMGSAAGGNNPLGPLSAFYYVEGNVQVGSSSNEHLAFQSSCEVHDVVTISADITIDSPTISGLTNDDIRYLLPGMLVSGDGISGGTTLQSVNYSGNILTLSQNATNTLDNASLTFTVTQSSYCWKVSIVAEGNIQIGGDFDMQPYQPPLLFLAGNDISLKGQAAQMLDGLVAAHQEIEFAGQMNMVGSVIAENGRHAPGQQVTTNRVVNDLVATNAVTGTGLLRKEGEDETVWFQLTREAWRELVF